MLAVHRLDPTMRRDVHRYIRLPFRLYRENAHWVPPFVDDVRAQLDPGRHPFYRHSKAAFFYACVGRDVVGRIAVLDNANYNRHHGEQTAFFYHFEAIDDRAVSRALFDAAFEWARGRGLKKMWGPQGLMPTDGKGLLVDGFEHRPALGIAYNHPYYAGLVEDAGFERRLDLISFYIDQDMSVPARILEIARKVKEKRNFSVVRFHTKAELRDTISQVTTLYNASFRTLQGYVPVSDAEAQLIAKRILSVADPKLIAILKWKEEVVGFIIAYPDITAAIQRCKGRVWPAGWYHLMREFKRTRQLDFNGVGILERFRGFGGNALLYSEIYYTVQAHPQYYCADLIQVQEANTRMIRELEAMRARPYKRHRVYTRSLI
jgi:hypothetical protein